MPPPFSKSQVDRAGKTLADGVRAARGEPALLADDAFWAQMVGSMEIVDWWRGEHAKPLSRVAVNLRHHVAKEGDPVIAQRLKKVPTIAAKLLREEGMRLSQMADIGGVRAYRGRLIEVQLRTSAQDIWANTVERLSRTRFPGLKFGEGPAALREYMSFAAAIIDQTEQGLISEEEARRLLDERGDKTIDLARAIRDY